MSGAFCFRDIHRREILSAEYLLGGLQDGLHTLVTRTRIDFHFFSNKNKDAIIPSGCGGLEKGLEALESLISEPLSQKTLRLWIAHTPLCFIFYTWIIHLKKFDLGFLAKFAFQDIQLKACVRLSVYYLLSLCQETQMLKCSISVSEETLQLQDPYTQTGSYNVWAYSIFHVQVEIRGSTVTTKHIFGQEHCDTISANSCQSHKVSHWDLKLFTSWRWNSIHTYISDQTLVLQYMPILVEYGLCSQVILTCLLIARLTIQTNQRQCGHAIFSYN